MEKSIHGKKDRNLLQDDFITVNCRACGKLLTEGIQRQAKRLVALPYLEGRKRSTCLWILNDLLEVIKIQKAELEQLPKPKIYGVKIIQDADKCYCISVRHTGDFRLSDYEELEFEVKSVRLVKRG